MESGNKPRKVVGIYDRPASADRRRGPWLAVVIAALIALAWIAYFAFTRG